MTPKQEFISAWHDEFVNYIDKLQRTVATFMQIPQITEEDKRGFAHVATILAGKDVDDIEKDLANAHVDERTLDKIEKVKKDLTDEALDHMSINSHTRDLWKQILHSLLNYDKQMEKKKLQTLAD